MKNIKLQNLKTVLKKINDSRLKIYMFIFSLCSPYNVAFAATGDGTDMWSNFIDFILPWVQRVGGAVFFFGLVEFGLSFARDDANSRTMSIRFMVAGAIVFAAGTAGRTFLV